MTYLGVGRSSNSGVRPMWDSFSIKPVTVAPEIEYDEPSFDIVCKRRKIEE